MNNLRFFFYFWFFSFEDSLINANYNLIPNRRKISVKPCETLNINKHIIYLKVMYMCILRLLPNKISVYLAMQLKTIISYTVCIYVYQRQISAFIHSTRGA